MSEHTAAVHELRIRMTAAYRRGQRDIIDLIRNDAKIRLLLIAHQRSSIEGCHCGWGELGKSHARHVLDELAKHLEAEQP